RYGRTVARVYVGETDVSLELVKAGFAWHYKKYSSDPILAQAEIEARNAKAGLWADPHAIAPWDFRHRFPGMQLVAAVGPFHGNLRSKVFHAPGCQHYECPNCRMSFTSVADAEALATVVMPPACGRRASRAAPDRAPPQFLKGQRDRLLDDRRPDDVVFERGRHFGVDRLRAARQAHLAG